MAEVDLNQCYKVAMEAISGAAKVWICSLTYYASRLHLLF